MATITARDFATLHALETYRHAITAAATIAAAAKAWIAVPEPLTAAIVDDLCTLYALTYKYRCLWDAAGPEYVGHQRNADVVLKNFTAFLKTHGKGWSKEQFDASLATWVDAEMDADCDWHMMMDFMIGDAGRSMGDIAQADRNVALNASRRIFDYVKPFSADAAYVEEKLQELQHMKTQTDAAEARDD